MVKKTQFKISPGQGGLIGHTKNINRVASGQNKSDVDEFLSRSAIVSSGGGSQEETISIIGEFGSQSDGISDLLSRGADYTGISDGQQWTVSTWYKLIGGDGSFRSFCASTQDRYLFRHNSNNRILVGCKANGFTSRGLVETISTYTVTSYGGIWIHLHIWWDASVPEAHIIVNGVDQSLNTVTALSIGNIDFTTTDHWIFGGNSGGNKLNGALSQYWFDTTLITDNSKFYNAGSLVDLGEFGELPKGGTKPLVFLDTGGLQNVGTGGDLTESGALELISGPGVV